MTVVFQYGSNMSSERLNHATRLAGDARSVGVARTIDLYDFSFSIWSKDNKCAAASIHLCGDGRSIFGVLYEVPTFLIERDSAKAKARRAMDAIEGEGTNYCRVPIEVVTSKGSPITAITYVGRAARRDVKTSWEYVQHILRGAEEHRLPMAYREYLCGKMIENNSQLREQLDAA